MIKHIYYNNLFDCYKNLLTDKQKETFILYHSEDNSLAEIAELQHASKQAVSEIIKRTEAILENYEEKLGIMRKRDETLEKVDFLFSRLSEDKKLDLRELESVRKQVREIIDNE